MLHTSFVRPVLPRGGALVLLVFEDAGAPGPETLHAMLEAATGGAVGRALSAAAFTGKGGQHCTLFAPSLEGGAVGPNRVVVAGLGKAAEFTPEAAEAAGGGVLQHVIREAEATVAADGLAASALAANLALGMVLRGYRFDRYRTAEKEDERPKLERVEVAVATPQLARAAWEPMRAVADGVVLARDLVSEPPNVLTPSAFAERCQELERLDLEVEVLGPKELKKGSFGALLATAQGSAEEPRVVVLRWAGEGAGERKKKDLPGPVVLVGKGVTFDSGGLSLKPGPGMEDMKYDMAGAAAVVGAMAALATRQARTEVVGVIGLTENMPSGTAVRPGDVVRSRSGQTIEVINTDAEGRLVLADLLHLVQERYRPRCIVDLATLTGAMVVALGHEHAGLFANDEALAQALLAAGRATGEACWRMPLGEAYDKQLKSDIADMKNVGGRPGGGIIAAQFLQRFVDKKVGDQKVGDQKVGDQKVGDPKAEGEGMVPWAHLDIAGVAWVTKDQPTVPKGASGWGVRLLDRLVADHYEG